ncbi:Rac GTPase-activating protein 1 [Halotydeus destructor]|nr:Rac GTPase-activating protein 1 [Halotydeus destructor]
MNNQRFSDVLNLTPQPTLSLTAQFDDLIRAQVDVLLLKEETTDGVQGLLVSHQQACRLQSVKPDYEEAVKEKDNRIKNFEKEHRALRAKLKDSRTTFEHLSRENKRHKQERDHLLRKMHNAREILDSNPVSEIKVCKDRLLSCLQLPQLGASEDETTENSLSDLEYDKSEDSVDATINSQLYGTFRSETLTELELEDRVDELPTFRENPIASSTVKSETKVQSITKQASKAIERSESAAVAPTRPTDFKGVPLKPQRSVPNVPHAQPTSSTQPLNTLSSTASSSVSKLVFERRPHKIVTKPWTMHKAPCSVCGEKLKFMSRSSYCEYCQSFCHPGCREQLIAHPCVPLINRNEGRQSLRLALIADYAPLKPPRIPATLVYCITEIERRGLTEEGLYRRSGLLKDVKELLGRFLSKNNKGLPSLDGYSSYTLCDVVKRFLAKLDDPILTRTLWRDFVSIVTQHETQVSDDGRYETQLITAINSLPEANRHSLAFLMAHLIKVVKAAVVKMNVENLATVFGPTVVGFSLPNVSSLEQQNQESKKQIQVMRALFGVNETAWHVVLSGNEATAISGPTSSSSSLRRRQPSLGGTLQVNGTMTPLKIQVLPASPSKPEVKHELPRKKGLRPLF